MKQLFKDAAGRDSMNRVLAFWGACIGTVISIGGVIGWLFMSLSDGPIIIGIGAALYGGSELLKNQGRRLENGGGK